MDFHPAANSFPMMDQKRYTELLDDIRIHGQREPITLCDGMVLDGRNRYKACAELKIEPKARTFDGDPWAYAWSLNGQRRDLGDDQRYLIWKFCTEHGAAWRAEQQRIADEANRKRSAAAREQHAVSNPRAGESLVREQSVPAPEAPRPGKAAKAAAAKVNAGAVARGDKLAKDRPDLADKVRLGEMKPAAAHREMKREQIVAKLKATAPAKAIEGVYDVIVIDPPWPIEKIERDCRPNQVALDYETMEADKVQHIKIPHAKDCHIWIWATHRFLPTVFEMIHYRRLTYVCTFVWHKPGGFQPLGLPQYNCEFALYCRFGKPQFIDTKAFPVCFNAPRGAHSEKPEEFYAMVRRVTAGRRLDMFNRRQIEGFDGWGKESPT